MTDNINQNLFKRVTNNFLKKYEACHSVFDPEEICGELLGDINNEIKLVNAIAPREEKRKQITELPASVTAMILEKLYNVKRISFSDVMANSNHLLGIYVSDPDQSDYGTYSTDSNSIVKIVFSLNFTASRAYIDNVFTYLKAHAPIVPQQRNRDYIPVKNGIFNYKTKELIPFSPDIVILKKSQVEYKENPPKCVITNADGSNWDIDSWIDSLTDDAGIRDLLWQILGAILRPYVSWNKACFLYGPKGCGGKSTFCVLLKQLCGEGNYSSVSFAELSERFGCSSLLHASAIICDENATKSFSERTLIQKSIITGDEFSLERKNQDSINFRFMGLMVQCFNALPKGADTSDSWSRRFIFIPMDKCFTGRENKAIKNDYLNRPEVLEYVLYKVLHMPDYYEFSESDACRALLGEFKTNNDPLRQFVEEIIPQCGWDLLPWEFLYALYKAYNLENNPSGKPQGKNAFINSMCEIMRNSDEWDVAKSSPVNIGNKMSVKEPLVLRYKLSDWGYDRDYDCFRSLRKASSYRGLVRKVPRIKTVKAAEAKNEDSEADDEDAETKTD